MIKRKEKSLLILFCIIVMMFSAIFTAFTTDTYAASSSTTVSIGTISAGRNNSGYTKIMWDDTGADKYYIYSSEDKSSWTKIGTTTDDYFVDTVNEEGGLYYYKVRAVVGSDYSSYSNIVGKTQALIQTPENLSISYSTSSDYRLTLSWDAATNAEGYEIYYSTDASNWTLYNRTTSTSIIIRNSQKYTTTRYYYKVRSYRTLNNNQQNSNYGRIMTDSTDMSISVARTNSGYTKITWNAADFNVSGYKVYRSTSANGTYSCIKTTTSTSYTDSSGTKNTKYYYKVRAYYKVNSQTFYTNYTDIVNMLMLKLARPSDVEINSSGKISWSAVSGATGYEIYGAYYINGNTTWTKVGTTTSASYTPSTTYSYYKVRAYKTISGVKYYTTYSTIRMSGVGTLSKGRSDTGYIKLTWTKSSSATTGYRVYRSSDGGSTWTRIKTITSSSTLSYTDKTATYGKEYQYKVRAYYTTSGTTYYTGYTNIVTSGQVNLVKASGLKVTAKSSTTIKLSWTKVTHADGYIIYRSTDKSTWTKVKTITSGSTLTYTNTVPSSTTSTVFYYKIRAYKTINGTKYCSNYSSVVSANVTDAMTLPAKAYYGKLTIGSYSAKTYVTYKATSSYLQDVVDASNSALVYISSSHNYFWLMDHSNQGLKVLWNTSKGDTATLKLNNGCVVTLTCTAVYKHISDSNISNYSQSNRILIKTCESSNGNRVTLWKISSYTSSTGKSVSSLISYATTRLNNTLF